MQPYQEEYLANLRQFTTLTQRKPPEGLSFEQYAAQLLEDSDQIARLSVRNMELLRGGLFPMLDDLFHASPEQLKELEEFPSSCSTASLSWTWVCFAKFIRLCSVWPGTSRTGPP